MTHEELLAKIETRIADFCDDEKDFCDVCSSWKALRAIVNLHWHNDIKSSTGEVLETYCLECPNLSSYPCLTIQAIEKELM